MLQNQHWGKSFYTQIIITLPAQQGQVSFLGGDSLYSFFPSKICASNHQI